MTNVATNIEVAKQLAHILCEALVEYGESPSRLTPDYSGRSMYGKECLGFLLDNSDFTSFAFTAVDHINKEVAPFANAAKDSTEHLVYKKAQKIIKALKGKGSTDNMGRLYIHYFKSVKFTDDEVRAMKKVAKDFQ